MLVPIKPRASNWDLNPYARTQTQAKPCLGLVLSPLHKPCVLFAPCLP